LSKKALLLTLQQELECMIMTDLFYFGRYSAKAEFIFPEEFSIFRESFNLEKTEREEKRMMYRLEQFEDPKFLGNHEEFSTGLLCAEMNCEKIGGSALGGSFCSHHAVQRLQNFVPSTQCRILKRAEKRIQGLVQESVQKLIGDQK